MKQVKINISKDGVVTYETQGYSGAECKEVQTAFIRMGSISDEKLTGEGCMPAERPAYNEIGYGQQP